MRMPLFIAFTLLFIWSCEWRPDEMEMDSTETLKNINLVIGDTLSIQIEGSHFSLLEGLDDNIAEVNEVINQETGMTLEIIGKNPGELNLFFNFIPSTPVDSEPLTASYFIHIRVSESIPLSINVGEQLQLDFSSYLSHEQLNNLDTVGILVIREIPGGKIRIEEVAGSLTEIILTGEIPGISGIEILCFDSQKNQIVALAFHIDISIHKTVLAELFTNTGCVNCPEANHYLDRISAEFPEDFAVVRYHVNWTDPSDPMNLYNPGDVETRRAYYNIFAAPGFVLDGTMVTSLDEDDWSGRVFNATQDVPPIYISTIDVMESVDSLYLGFDLDTFGKVLSEITVWSLVFEDSIEYSGSNGENLHMEVMRDMTSSTFSSLNGLKTIRHSLKKPDGYMVTGPMSILVFTQSESDKAVLQARNQILY